MPDPMPVRRTRYSVDHRIARHGGWVTSKANFPEVGWAVSAMHRCAAREPHLDWRVSSGGGLNHVDGLLVVHRIRLAGDLAPHRDEPPPPPVRRTVEQSWKRLPAPPEDDPF
jgi:hypothetical protein